jgi:hypothetical protein
MKKGSRDAANGSGRTSLRDKGQRFKWTVLLCIACSFAAILIGLWAYEKYQTQLLINRDYTHAASDYADSLRRLNDERERFRNSP